MIPDRLVLATANPGKRRELRELVAGWGPVVVAGLDAFAGVELPDERGGSYAENAVAKATAAARATGLPALGDAERIAKLLAELRDVPEARRAARFVCVVAAVFPDGRVATAEGVCRGRIAAVPAGRAGFGYDPVFVPEGFDRTLAEVGAEAKQRLSHRARAVRSLGERLQHGPAGV